MENDTALTEGKTILVADDNPENLGVLDHMLSKSGFRIRIARDGEQVLRSAQAERPDLILLDVHMPRMDGYEACAKLKEDPRLADIPVVFISALSDPFNKEQAFSLGAFDYLEKPFRFDEVRIRLSNALKMSYYKRRCAELERELELARAELAGRPGRPEARDDRRD